MRRGLFLGIYTVLVILIIELLIPNMNTIVKVAIAGIIGLIGGILSVNLFPKRNKKEK